MEGLESTDGLNRSKAAKDAEPKPTINDVQEQEPAKDIVVLNLTKEFEELTTKLNKSDSKMKEVSFSPNNSFSML